MYKIKYDGNEIALSEPVLLQDLSQHDRSICAALVNNRLRPLDYVIKHDSDVTFLRLNDDRATGVYKSTLRFVFVMACYNLYPEYNIKLSYNISRSFLAHALNFPMFTEEMKKNIEKEMKRIIKADLPITRYTTTKEEAIKIYNERNMLDKIDILQYRPSKKVHFAKCDNYLNYMYGYLLPSTGYLSAFELRIYEKGLLLRYPRCEVNATIPPFEDESTYARSLKFAYRQAKLINADTIYKINKHLEDPISKIEFINMCEARQNADLAKLADRISENIKNVKLICIAGPSSSGKTTFSNRLRIQLMSKGIKPVKLSIDDYYIDRRVLGLPDDQIDFEDINIIDIKLFNEHLVKLINGEEIVTPLFDFKSGHREVGKKMKLEENQPIIIEGIHALNEQLTPLIDRSQKYKIYIAPHMQISIDNHNPLSSVYLRLLRRIVRDNKYRGYSAERTLAQWESVRNGEFKWIYVNEEGVDFVYNSELTYEVAVLKKHAMKLINKISEDSPYYVDANQLHKFLQYFIDIDDDLVPNNSLLREFIGGSVFKDV